MIALAVAVAGADGDRGAEEAGEGLVLPPGSGAAVATLPPDLWRKALELGLDSEPAALSVILARAVLEKAEAECPLPLAEIAAEAGAFIDAAVAALEGGTRAGGFEA